MSYNNNNQSILKSLLFLAVVPVLSSCTTLSSQSTSPGNPNSGSAAAMPRQNSTANVVNQAETLPVVESPVNSEQQRLINEINRNGQRVSNLGLRDAAPTPVNFEGENVVELNYEQAELRIVIEELAEALDITITIDPTINDKVSIRTAADRPLGIEDVWPLLRMLSRDAGVLIERIGNVYNARKVQANLPSEIVTPDTLSGSTAALLMQVTPLTYISAEAAKEVVGPILGSADNVRQLTTNNTLLITANEFELDRINQLLTLVDADPFSSQGIQLFQLGNANAEEVATELTEILLLIEGTVPSYQVRGIERINGILVTAPAGRGFDEIERWVKILDAESQEQVEQLFYYKVRNLNAVELAETLSQVFEEDDDDTPPVVNTFTPPRLLALGQVGPQVEETTTSSNDNGGLVAADLRVKIVSDEATNSLLIRSTARDYRQLLTTINRLDTVPLQVMINAVIAQVTLTDGNEFGVDWSRIAENSAVDDISTETTTNFVPGDVGGLLFSKSFIDGAARIDATLAAIASNNDVRLLARPTLTVANNQEGEIRIGSEVPVEQGQNVGANGTVTSNIQYRDTGIELTITPQINNDGIVNLEIRQELSSVDSGAVGVNDNPIFNNQDITTSVVVRDGENVVLGGLIQSDDEDLNTGVPGLNRIPLLGGLFSYQQRQTRKQELFIVLRPEVIDLNSQTSLQYSEIVERFEIISRILSEDESQM
ncbi:MAG: secretin N-terminal domain-containing protein [Pseudohongiellaceae bacterium]